MKKAVFIGSMVGVLSLLVPAGAAFAAGGTQAPPSPPVAPSGGSSTVTPPTAGSTPVTAPTVQGGAATSSATAEPGGPLAFTGAEIAALVGFGGLLVVVGLLLLVVGRIRMRSRAGTS